MGSIICEPDDLVHTHSITGGERTINPAACSVVSAVSSQACSLLYSANMYKESSLEVLCFYKHKVKQREGLEVNATCSSTRCLNLSLTLSLTLYWYLWGSFHFSLKHKSLTLQDRVWRSSTDMKLKLMEEPWIRLYLKVHTTECKFDIVN